MEKGDAQKMAKSLVKAELARRDISYEELADILTKSGVPETKENVTNKINRGKFSFSFVLQVANALGIKSLNLKIED